MTRRLLLALVFGLVGGLAVAAQAETLARRAALLEALMPGASVGAMCL
jgi:hypothetical protein